MTYRLVTIDKLEGKSLEDYLNEPVFTHLVNLVDRGNTWLILYKVPDFKDPAVRVQELEMAIRKHRDAKGHDRCWENDLELYSALQDGVKADPELPSHDEFLARCEQYYQCQKGKL